MDLLLLAATCLVNLILGVLIVVRDTRKIHTRLFLLMSIVISLWIIANYFTNHFFGSYLLIDTANRLAFMMGYGIVVSGLLFTYFFPTIKEPRKPEVVFLASLIMLTLILSLTPMVAGGVVVTGETVSFTAGSAVLFYLASFLVIVGFIAKNLIILPPKVTLKVRQQARLILIAFVMSALFGLTLNLVIPLLASGWQATRVGPVSTVFLVVIIAYTIIKHGLFDIRAAIIRTVTYVLTVATVVGIYSLVVIVGLTNILGFTHISVLHQVTLLALTFIIGLSLPLLVRFFDSLTRKIFLRGTYDFQATVNEMTNIFSEAASLRLLLKKTSARLESILGAEFVTITLSKDGDTMEQTIAYTTQQSHSKSTLPLSVLEYMASKDVKIISTDELGEDEKLGDELRRTKTSVVVGLHTSTAILGYIIVGHKQTGTAYRKRDLDLLDTLSDEFTIAVQNMLRFEEITQFNSSLQQRINEATKQLRVTNNKLHQLDQSKDEFISMASHQLRTPLTSVKGYISMMLEGDIGKITPQQRKVLEQAYDSSQRMVFLIGDFLNVSRIQTGKFELEPSKINFTDLVAEEVDQLKDTAKMREITLKYDKPSAAHVSIGDENKLRQVMMNFMDNSIYYSAPDTTITVQLYREANHIVFKVHDTGIGVPKEEQSKLFTKFFRATNARQQRPDGTGIGLYMAKKVIVAHDGTIIFESKVGEGSTFGFSLPLKDELKQLDKQPDATAGNSRDDSTKTK